MTHIYVIQIDINALIAETLNSIDLNSSLLTLKKTIIDKNTELKSGIVHKYDILIIKQGFELTVNEWKIPSGLFSFNILEYSGGKLILKCNSLILENNSEITVNGKGYKGGKIGCYQGYSYNEQSYWSKNSNYGGGGWISGGGYGTNGENGDENGKGGLIYGNNELTKIYLGSGGGGGHKSNGTSGGGAIIIECEDNIIIGKNSYICANGENSTNNNGIIGCGSGGSIYLKSPNIINNGFIQAIGGINNNKLGGNGGFGRIRIDCKNEIISNIEKSNILPKVGCFGEI